MEACLEDMKSLLRKRLGLPQQSLATQTHTPTRVSRADLAQSPLHGVAEHMFVTAIEIGEASTTETTQSHKLLAEGSDFAAVTDSVSVVADHPEETTPAVSTDPTPSLFLLNPPTPNTLTETVGSSMEKKFEVNHELTAPPQPNPPNASIPDFTKHENPLRLQMNFTLISKVCMSWYWVRSVREANAELEWEKLKRTLLDGLFFPTLGYKCVGSGDTNKKTQIQICWVWQKEYKILMQHFPHHSTVFLALGQNFREAIEDTTKRMGAGMAKISCKLVETVVDYDDSSGSVILVVIPCVNLASTTAELVVEMLQQGSSKFINHFFVIPAVLERKNVRYWRLWADYRRMIRASLVLGKSLFDAGKNDFSLNELIPTDGQGFNTSYAAIYDIFVARSLQENFLGSKYAYNFKMPSVLVQRGNDLFSLFTQDLYMLDSETTELHNLILAAIYVKSRLLNNFWVACGAGNLVFRAG